MNKTSKHVHSRGKPYELRGDGFVEQCLTCEQIRPFAGTHTPSNERVSDKRLAELVSHYESVDKQHNGWWVAVYWCLRELQERRSAHETSRDDAAYQRGFAEGSGDEGYYQRTIHQLKEAIYWALGERGEFGSEPEPLAGKYRRAFWWRTELRQRSGLPIDGQSSPVEPTRE